MARVFRVGMIGTGGIANRHATILQKLVRTELVAFCDIVEEQARQFNEKYADGKGKVYTDYHVMLEKTPLDVVYVCLPPFAHSDEVEAAAATARVTAAPVAGEETVAMAQRCRSR